MAQESSQVFFKIIWVYLMCKFLVRLTAWSAPLVKDFRCELEQPEGRQGICNWPPCIAADTSCYSYSNLYQGLHMLHMDIGDTLVSHMCGDTLYSTCSFIPGRTCYNCEDSITIPQELSTFHEVYVPFMFVCFLLQLLCIPFQSTILCFLGKIQQRGLAHLFYPEASLDQSVGSCTTTGSLKSHKVSKLLTELAESMEGDPDSADRLRRHGPNIICNATLVRCCYSDLYEQ